MEERTGDDSASQISQQTVSDDDEIDYSSKPEFYGPELDEKDEIWARKQRRGHTSDAVLSCPACFTTLCLDSQRHEKIVTQYRAIFVVNCKITEEATQPGSKRKWNKRGSETEAAATQPGSKRKWNKRGSETEASAETFKNVCCSVCSTKVGVFDEDEIYHFLNVLPSEA